jgi:hypothetical protein
MASTAGPEQGGKTPVKGTPNYGRRIKSLGIFTAFLMLAWTGGWFYLAKIGGEQVDLAIAKVDATDKKLSCGKRDIKGYPFRFGLFCDSVMFEEPAKGVRILAGALRTAAQVYNPWHLVAELDGPASIDAPGLQPLEINWSLLHASVRANKPVPDQVSVEAKSLNISIRGQAEARSRAVLADYAAGHMRIEDRNAAFAGEVDGLLVDPAITPGREVPSLSVSYDAVLTDGVRIITSRPKNAREALRGASGEIRSARVIFKDGGTLELSGPLSVGADGLIDGDVKIKFADADRLGSALAKIAPEAASVIKPALSGAALTAGKDKEAGLTLTIRKGKVSAGFFPLGKIPPI